MATSAMTPAALVRAETAGGGPGLTGGDFNALGSELPCAFSLDMASWKDLHCGGTCSANTATQVRRIELLFANVAFRSLVREVRISWDWLRDSRCPIY